MQATFPWRHLPSRRTLVPLCSISARAFTAPHSIQPAFHQQLKVGSQSPLPKPTDNRGRPTSDSHTAVYQRQQLNLDNSNIKEKLMELQILHRCIHSCRERRTWPAVGGDRAASTQQFRLGRWQDDSSQVHVHGNGWERSQDQQPPTKKTNS